MAWVRCRFELYLPLFWVSLSLSISSPLSFFLPFLSYTIQARTRISVYICLVCINALGLRELRHDLVCITMPVVCVNPCHYLVCNKCPWFA